MSRVRSPIRYYGGKQRWAQKIVELLPSHEVYVEPFGGAASVLLAKPPAPKMEVYNDLNERLVNFWQVVRDHGDELQKRLQLTPYSETEWRRSREKSDDLIEDARRLFVSFRVAFGGKESSFGYSVTCSCRGMSRDVSQFLTAIDEKLPAAIERMRTVQVMCRDGTELIKRFDGPNVLFYCDPPYVAESRAKGATKIYTHEMTAEQHDDLLDTLNDCRGSVVLSGYSSDRYDAKLSSWQRHEFEISSHAKNGARQANPRPRRTEVIWIKEATP